MSAKTQIDAKIIEIDTTFRVNDKIIEIDDIMLKIHANYKIKLINNDENAYKNDMLSKAPRTPMFLSDNEKLA